MPGEAPRKKPDDASPPTRKDEPPPGQVVFGESAFIDESGRETRKTESRLGMPKQIGQYVVVRELGRGGMGVVYLARQPSLNRLVALKVLNINMQGDPEDAARFQHEAKLAASLRHPNIVQIYEIGQQDGYAFMAMEYVEGGSLHHFLADNKLESREAAELIEPLARAMHYAHQRGIIHRDLKPANILLELRNAESGARKEETVGDASIRNPNSVFRNPKITDFGLAKNMNQSMHLTATGVALGTPSYMAPEQAKDDRKNIGPISDVYALGALFYECLTGQPPFSGSTPLVTMQQVVRARPTPPSQIRPGVPKVLEKICLKCLEKNPKNRYASAEALADALKWILDRADPDAQPGATRSFLLPLLAALLVISLIGNVVLFALWRWQ